MSDIFQLVRDHLEAFDHITQEWQIAQGTKTITQTLARPAAWIERVHERGVMTALDCVSVIVFALDDWSASPTHEQAKQLTEGWAAELRNAALSGEIQPRDPFTLLPLNCTPEGWAWGILASDADKFLAARGVTWKCGEIAAHIYNQVLPDIEAKRFPTELFSKPQALPEAAEVQPDSITSRQVATFFDGLPYTAENWPKRLSDTKWLQPAKIALGEVGGLTGLWCPLILARLIHGRKKGREQQKTLKALNSQFKRNTALEPWRDAWNEHYALFTDAIDNQSISGT